MKKEKILVRQIVQERLLGKPFEINLKDFKINLLIAGVGIGKSYFKVHKMISSVLSNGITRKFIGRTPLTISVLTENKKLEKLRKKIEKTMEEKLGKDIDLKLCKTIEEFIDTPPSQYAILLTNDGQFLNSSHSKPSKDVTRLMDYCKKVKSHYGYNAAFICADEIAYGGSTEEATTKGNTSKNKQGGYKAAWITWLIEFAKEVGIVVGMTGTTLNEQVGELKYAGIIKELMDNPDIYNMATEVKDFPTAEELTNFVSNINETIFAKHENLLSSGVDKFLNRLEKGKKLALRNKPYFDLKFNPNQKLFVTTSVNTYRGVLKDRKEASIPHYLAIEEVVNLYIDKGFSPNQFYFFETTENGNYAFNSKAVFEQDKNNKMVLNKSKSKGNFITIKNEGDIERILSGNLKEHEDSRLLDIQVIFAIEKLKMAANIPSLNTIIMCRARKGQYLNDGNFIFVQIEQAYGRIVREFFGIDFEKEMCAEEVLDYVYEKYGKHKNFNSLLYYLKFMHSHDVICPDDDIYRAADKEIFRKKVSAPIDYSVFSSKGEKELEQGIIEIFGNEYDVLEGNLKINTLQKNNSVLKRISKIDKIKDIE